MGYTITEYHNVCQQLQEVREQRDQFANLLRLAVQLAEQNPGAEARDSAADVYDGLWLATLIQDALGGQGMSTAKEHQRLHKQVAEERELRIQAEQERDRLQAEQERDRLQEERDRLQEALNDLLKEAEAFEEMSKHLARECREARRILAETE